MCAHAYNNHLTPALGQSRLGGAPQQYRLIPQAEKPMFSKLTSWESPDPNFWVSGGYAIVNMNLPGYANSDGPPSAFSEHQGKCYYEAIEWVAKQPWCTGKVGLNGVSFLAISQYHVAACQAYGGPPPSLCCISPWEGLTDPYRDIFAFGGLSEVGFPAFWWATEVKPALNGTQKDFVESEGCIPTDYLKNHPLYDDFWKAKAAKLDEITIPMLVCASFSDHRGSPRDHSLAALHQGRVFQPWHACASLRRGIRFPPPSPQGVKRSDLPLSQAPKRRIQPCSSIAESVTQSDG
jgi:predicted acyl esterase